MVICFIVLAFVLSCKAQLVCDACSLTYSSCVLNSIANSSTTSCSCVNQYLSCWNGASCPANGIAATCDAYKTLCSLTSCPAATGCTACEISYSSCLTHIPTDTCTCLGTYQSCITAPTCGVSADALCSSYGTLCPSLNCPPATGCAACTSDYTACAVKTPTSICTCLESYGTCSSGSTCNLGTEFDTVCPIYQTACPSIHCSVNATGCVLCSVDYIHCAISSIAAGSIAGVCTCIETMYHCLSGSTCGLAPYSGLCGVYNSFCPHMQCGTGSNSPAPTQITGIFQQFKTEIAQYIEKALAGSNITFGTITARGASQLVLFEVILDDAVNRAEYFSNFLTEVAKYFNIEHTRLALEFSIKRTQTVSGQLVVNPTSSGASLRVGLLFVVMLLLTLWHVQ